MRREKLLSQIEESQKKIEWTLEQLKPGRSEPSRKEEAMQMLDNLEKEKLELEKKEVQSHNTIPQRIAGFYINFFGSSLFIVLFTLFILVWIGVNIYLVYTGKNSATNLAIVNTVMIGLGIIQIPFIMISLKLLRKNEKEDEEVEYERERLNLKMQTHNAEELEEVREEQVELEKEHKELHSILNNIQDSINAIKGELNIKEKKKRSGFFDERPARASTTTATAIKPPKPPKPAKKKTKKKTKKKAKSS